MSLAKKLTSLAHRFLQPVNATHRQYEALRAYCVEGLPSAQAAARFGYSPGSFRVLVHEFRQDPERAFFHCQFSFPSEPVLRARRAKHGTG
jgi:hypothetical protein